LMRIPSEIRLMIYELLFDDKGHKVLEIRNDSPELYKNRKSHNRTEYRVLGTGLTRQSQAVTYRLTTNTDIHTSIMGVNRKIHEETTHLLYSSHSFDFGRDIEAIVPFFSDLTRETRPLVQEISLTKQGFVYSRDFDRCEWSNVCEFLRTEMCLKSMNLVVEGGRPSLGWEGLPEYSQADFKTLSSVKYEALEWVWDLLKVRVRNLEVTSEIHHCAVPDHSSGVAFFAAFSSCIETGFADYLRGEMLIR